MGWSGVSGAGRWAVPLIFSLTMATWPAPPASGKDTEPQQPDVLDRAGDTDVLHPAEIDTSDRQIIDLVVEHTPTPIPDRSGGDGPRSDLVPGQSLSETL